MSTTQIREINSPERRHYSPSAHVQQVESHKLIPTLIALAIVNALIAGVALGIALWALSYADKARMEARVEQVKTEGFYRALIAAGIDPNPHVKGENP
jgi:hypothetical protein